MKLAEKVDFCYHSSLMQNLCIQHYKQFSVKCQCRGIKSLLFRSGSQICCALSARKVFRICRKNRAKTEHFTMQRTTSLRCKIYNAVCSYIRWFHYKAFFRNVNIDRLNKSTLKAKAFFCHAWVDLDFV